MVLRLCEHFLGIKSYTYIIEPQFGIPESGLSLLSDALERLYAAEPLQYVLGCADFYGRSFKVSPAVLIPRPETESLCRKAIELAGQRASGEAFRVLDLCTGSGCIAWTMALELACSRVVGVDISDAALEVASSQPFYGDSDGQDDGAKRGKSGAVPTFVKADVLDLSADGAMKAVEAASGLGQFDMILSNPPYVKECEKSEMRRNVLEYEPDLALFVSDGDPLVFYRAVAGWSGRFLAPGGYGIVEINEDLGPETMEIFRERFGRAELMKDILDKNRFVVYRKQAL